MQSESGLKSGVCSLEARVWSVESGVCSLEFGSWWRREKSAKVEGI